MKKLTETDPVFFHEQFKRWCDLESKRFRMHIQKSKGDEQ